MLSSKKNWEKESSAKNKKSREQNTEWSSVKSILVTSWFYPGRCDEKIILSCQVPKLLWAYSSLCCSLLFKATSFYALFQHISPSNLSDRWSQTWELNFQKIFKTWTRIIFQFLKYYNRKFFSRHLKMKSNIWESWLSGRIVGLQNIFRFGSFRVWNWVKIAFED